MSEPHSPTVTSGPWYSRARLGHWVESTPVQRVIIGVILINAAVLGIQTAPRLSGQAAQWLDWVDVVCLGIFIVEILIKLYAFRWKFFTSAWNNFDFIVVAIALVPGSGFAVLRALRVLRVLRLISMVPALRRVVEALVRAIPGIMSIGALLCILFYVGAVMATTLFGESFPEYFGTLGASLISLFQTMTTDNWSTLSREVAATYPWAWAFFIPFILISAFTVLNLFIAVMVDAMKFLNDGDSAGGDSSGEDAQESSPADGAVPSPLPARGRENAPDNGNPPHIEDYQVLLTEVRALRAELAEHRDR